ncbi:MAG: tetratricopeptide repeat protein [Oligoflexia bacterium]|nr:tetratricopeptide repeat protein [Oligoflexia bacterium]
MRRKIVTISLAALTLISLQSCFKSRAEIAREKEEKEMSAELQKSVFEYESKIEKMQGEMGRLNGKLEEIEHLRKKEYTGLSTGRENLEKVLDELRQSVQDLSKSQATLFDEIKRMKEDNLQLLKSLKDSSKQAAPQKKSAKKPSYYEGVKSFQAKDYVEAIDSFQEYLKAYPKGKNVVNANYYLGESLFRKKEYSDAVLAYSVVQEKSPSSSMGRKSTLKIAESLKALGKNDDAKVFVNLLQQTSPKSKEAEQAKALFK